jgi:hypothetical protein
MEHTSMLTRETIITALAALPTHDQRITDWVQSRGWNLDEFVKLIEPMDGRRELMNAGLRLRVATWEATYDENRVVRIGDTLFEYIRGRKA